jgi:hypothetical protein
MQCLTTTTDSPLPLFARIADADPRLRCYFSDGSSVHFQPIVHFHSHPFRLRGKRISHQDKKAGVPQGFLYLGPQLWCHCQSRLVPEYADGSQLEKRLAN